MVSPGGTPFVSSTFSRVTSNLSRSVILSNLRRSQEEILRAQEQISTGIRVTRPSVDPVGANQIMDFQIRLNRSEQFVRNLETSTRRLNMGDVSMGQANEIINRARVLLLGQVQSTATADTRRLAAQEVSELLRQAVSLSNTRFEDHSLFAGSRSTISPLQFAGGAVAFAGNNRELLTNVADGLSMPTNILANDAFGVYSDEIRGVDLATLQPIDLNPGVVSATSITSLRGGQGISMGSISITGSGTSVVDLRIADTIGDVIDLINAQTAVTGITASISPSNDGLTLTRAGGGAIIVTEALNGTTANQLGIYTGSLGVVSPLTGGDINPALTPMSTIGDLFGGAGLSTASGITITNAASDATYTATLGPSVFAPTNTIQNLLNAINSSNTYVEARLNESGTAIDIFSRLSGGRLTISEASGAGTTAAELGLLSTLNRADLHNLNNGFGVDTVDGFDLRITRRDGVQVFLDVDNLTTVQDLVDAIDADPFLNATLSGNSIVVTDTTGGVGNLRIENFNGSYAASNLGIEANVAASTVSGTALGFVGVQVEGLFTALVNLRDALLANDAQRISASQRVLDISQNKLLSARAEVGTRVAGLELTRNRIENEKTELSIALSNVRDVDLAEAATRLQLQQTVLEAGLAVAARIMQTSILNYL